MKGGHFAGFGCSFGNGSCSRGVQNVPPHAGWKGRRLEEFFFVCPERFSFRFGNCLGLAVQGDKGEHLWNYLVKNIRTYSCGYFLPNGAKAKLHYLAKKTVTRTTEY